MAKSPAIFTKRRLILGALVAAIVGVAIVLLAPDARQGLLSGSPYGEPVERDLDAISKDTLRVLVIQHHLTYTRSKGAETGLEYEMLERFARELHLHIKAIIVQHSDSLLPMLQRGAGDVVAAHLTGQNRYARWMIHSVPYRHVSPVFVTLRPDHVLGVNLGDQPAPDTAWVSAWSPFAPRELRFPGNDGNASLKGRTVFTDTSCYADNAVINVALGRTRAAIISDASAAFFAQCFPQLSFSEPFDAPVPQVFGLRTNARQLQRALDLRLNDPSEKEAIAMLMSAYGVAVPDRGPLGSMPCTTEEGAHLPGYDHHARPEDLGRDWDLLAAIAFQGDVLDSAEILTPIDGPGPTGSAALIDTLDPVRARAHVHAAARYMSELDSLLRDDVPDPSQRLRFVAAAYSNGPGHVMDARALALRLRLDPQRWEGSVERTITLLALPRYFASPEVKNGPCKGDEAFIRVREMVCLYDHYRATTHR